MTTYTYDYQYPAYFKAMWYEKTDTLVYHGPVGGGDIVDLSDTAAASQIYVSGGTANLQFLYPNGTFDSHVKSKFSVVDLSTYTGGTGRGASFISTSDTSGVTFISDFRLGLDTLVISMGSNDGGRFSTQIVNYPGVAQQDSVAITDPTGSHGVVLDNFTPSQIMNHASVTGAIGHQVLTIA